MTRFSTAPELPSSIHLQLPFHRRVFERGAGERIHFIDEGDGPAVLLMHGNPTWSYLWRKVIPQVRAHGFRVIVPDLIGFGLSSKPRSVKAHSLQMHIDAIGDLVDALEIDSLTVVGQDWGGPIGAGVGMRFGDRTRAAVFGNTGVIKPARPMRTKPFHKFSRLPLVSDVVFRGLAFPAPTMRWVQGDKDSIGVVETFAYCYPLRMIGARAGPLALARMVPNHEDHPSTAVMDRIGEWWSSFDRPIALVWGKKDPILGRGLKRHRKAFPDALVIRTQAGHFSQEEIPDEWVRGIRWVEEQAAEGS